MEKKMICIHCLNEIKPNVSRCPECGNGVARSKTLYKFLGNEEKKGNGIPTPETVARKINVYPSAAKRILNKYYPSFGELDESNLPELNTVIQKVEVKNLFGYLNYSINLDYDMSIIIAPNGFGKTTVFNFIKFMLNPDMDLYFEFIKNVPYEKVSVTLQNGTVLALAAGQEIGEFTFSANNVPIKAKNEYGEEVDTITEFSTKIAIPIPEDEYDLRRSDEEEYYANKLNAAQQMNQVLNRANIRSQLFFIKTNRAVVQPVKQQVSLSRLVGEEVGEKMVNPVLECNDDLVKEMNKAKDKYQKLVERAKNLLPKLFLSDDSNVMSMEEFKENWNNYRKRVNELVDFGLLDEQEILEADELVERDFEETTTGKKRFLSIYVSQYIATLKPFDDIYNKMKVFQDIINERNKNTAKAIRYCEKGIEYLNFGKPFNLDYLSSGEKNDFIMFFDLIFRTRKGTTILIDEPEISLHIVWQEHYIDNVYKALEGKDCQVIICTHSPDIISTHDDLLADIIVENDMQKF